MTTAIALQLYWPSSDMLIDKVMLSFRVANILSEMMMHGVFEMNIRHGELNEILAFCTAEGESFLNVQLCATPLEGDSTRLFSYDDVRWQTESSTRSHINGILTRMYVAIRGCLLIDGIDGVRAVFTDSSGEDVLPMNARINYEPTSFVDTFWSAVELNPEELPIIITCEMAVK